MSTQPEVLRLALEALENGKRVRAGEGGTKFQIPLEDNAMTALRAALAQQDEPQTIDEAMQQPRAMAQAYENGYNAGVATEREACAKVCDDLLANPHTGGGWSDAIIEAAVAIRARRNT